VNCEQGEHRFKPFKRSRDLFCSACGITRTTSGRHSLEYAVRSPQNDNAHAGASELHSEERDPYRDEAKRILEQATFEKVIDRILDEAGAIGPIRDRLRYEATSFGTTLDLDKFASYANETVERIQVETPMEDLLNDFGGE